MSISISELKPSLTIEYNNEPYVIIECEHAKIARGSSFVRAKIKNMITSQVLDCTLRNSDKIKPAFIEKKKMTFSYRNGSHCHFFDSQTYEDFILDESQIKEKTKYLKENLTFSGLFYNHKLINLELPPSIILEVTATEPGFRGDTVKSGTKPATLETGLVIEVPLFIKEGDRIKVDTRKQQYLERV